MKIILVSGKARHGKDTAAELMASMLHAKGMSAKIIHYADLLKYLCKQYFNWNGEKDDAGRTLLQHVGTDVIRAQNPDYWVDFVISFVRLFEKEWDFVIIPDTRFPNEIERWKQEGFDVSYIRVVRPEFQSDLSEEQMNHPSETALDHYPADFLVNNSRDLAYLQDKLSMVVSYILWQAGLAPLS